MSFKGQFIARMQMVVFPACFDVAKRWYKDGCPSLDADDDKGAYDSFLKEVHKIITGKDVK